MDIGMEMVNRMNQSADKGPALMILLVVAFGISGVGVALDDKAMSSASGMEAPQENTAQSLLSQTPSEAANPAHASMVTRQLLGNTDIADKENAVRLDAKVATTTVEMEEINQIDADKE